MKKKAKKIDNKLLLVFLLGIFLVGTFLIFIFIFGPKKHIPKPPPFIAQSPETQFLEAIEKDKSACQDIQDKYYHNLCLYNFTLKEAVKNKNPSICESLNQDFKETCKNNYYFQIAQKEGNLVLCDKIKFGPLKDQCQKEVKKLGEVKKATENPCQNLKGGEVKDVCLALFSISQNGQAPNESQCRSLKNQAAKEICLAIIRNQGEIATSLEEKYSLICEDIQEQSIRDLCLELFEQLLR